LANVIEDGSLRPARGRLRLKENEHAGQFDAGDMFALNGSSAELLDPEMSLRFDVPHMQMHVSHPQARGVGRH
jgi:hypothetical protein